MNYLRGAVLPLFLVLCPLRSALAEPLWEAGLGVTVLALSDYRGADTSSSYVLPIPYFVYRGDFLRSDRDGVRGVFMERPRFEINLSVSATAPVNSGELPARAGMPDLDPALELGPVLEWRAWQSADGHLRLGARIPVRAAFALGSGMGFIGWFSAPNFSVDLEGTGPLAQWNLGALFGPLFADSRYHEYFYGVESGFVTPQRPYYRADGGYSGVQALVSATRRFPRFWIGGFARYDRLDGAVFGDSPLVVRHSSWSTGLAISWVFAQSSRSVPDGTR